MEEPTLGFHDMGLDDRLLIAISELKWKSPTLIQEKAIPLSLEGKDVLAKARTGSGKTGAYVIPLIQKILNNKKVNQKQQTTALVLAPSRELCKQIYKNVKDLTAFCGREVRCFDVSEPVHLSLQKPLLVEKPDIIIGTPSRVLSHMNAGNIFVQDSLKDLVIDEADLVFGFGYKTDIDNLMQNLPAAYQSSLMSATLTSDVLSLKKIVLHNPVILKLEEPELPSLDRLTQYHVNCEEEEKFVLTNALFKLNLIRGKTIIFVRSVDRSFKLKLFLEQFGVKSCILNSELPVTSRCHIVHQFNEGLYNIIIASDEKMCDEKVLMKDKFGNTKRKRKRDEEYGVSRGIDFQFVSNVINFDFPPTVDSYIHRVGRTARGNSQGTALSYVSIKDQPVMKLVEEKFAENGDLSNGSIFRPYQFKMEEIEGFRYRSRDALRAVTTIAVRESRLKEIKEELLKSQKLKTYFEDNPRDHQALRHDKALHTVKLQSYLHDVPDYIVPPTLKNMVQAGKRKFKGRPSKNVTSRSTNKNSAVNHKNKKQKKKSEFNDPLRTFKVHV